MWNRTTEKGLLIVAAVSTVLSLGNPAVIFLSVAAYVAALGIISIP